MREEGAKAPRVAASTGGVERNRPNEAVRLHRHFVATVPGTVERNRPNEAVKLHRDPVATVPGSVERKSSMTDQGSTGTPSPPSRGPVELFCRYTKEKLHRHLMAGVPEVQAMRDRDETPEFVTNPWSS
jgi:hypothetical protein